jgi:protease-4
MPPYPGYGMPPIVIPPQRGRSFASAILTTFAVTLFGLSLTLNFYFLVVAGVSALAASGPQAMSEVIVAGDPGQKVYELEIKGVIDDETHTSFAKLLRQVREDSSTRALIVHIDTPGGTVTASDEIYQQLRAFRTQTKLPVAITQGGLATSGGYYISAAGDRVFSHRTTLTGNIGVLMQRFNLSKLMNRYGVEDATITSTGATFKDAGSMFREESPAERAYLQSLMDQAFTTFKDVIVEGRGSRLKGSIDSIANGKVYTASEALNLGLVDELGGRDAALAWLAKQHALTSPTVVKLEETPTLASLFGVTTSVGSGEARVDIARDLTESVLYPRPMYLWRGH